MLATPTPRPGSSRTGLAGRRYHAPPPGYRGPVCPDAPASPEAANYLFHDRKEAGIRLAAALTQFQGKEDVLVMGIPRGGVVVAAEIARALNAPLDVWISCTLRPHKASAGVGSISEDGDMVVDEAAVERMQIPHVALVQEIRLRRQEVKERAEMYRGGQPPSPLFGKTVVLVDDGITTGSSARIALQGILRSQVQQCILAVPVAPQLQAKALEALTPDILVLETPVGFQSVAGYYVHFKQVTDAEVIDALRGPSQP